MNSPSRVLSINGRDYHTPEKPTVVICIDGSEPGYIEKAIDAGAAPTFARFMNDGSHAVAHSVIPSFTNPNNVSIVTGRPPSVHGIVGNYFYDVASGLEVMMNDPKFLRVPTILSSFHDAGFKVVAITAKDKLRALLSHGLDPATGRAIVFSAEKADQATRAQNGIDDTLMFVGRPLPEVYSSELSEFVFDAGVKLVQRHRPDLMYLSTTDYVQHKAGIGTKLANDFYAMIDRYLAQLDFLGCNIVVTADHGMHDKHSADGRPNVIYLRDLLDSWSYGRETKVILPITDPYVVHHGSLGSFAMIYLSPGANADALITTLRGIGEIELVLTRADACRRFELPPDRVGDIVVICSTHGVIGTSEHRHDLSGLTEPLRSHGGLSEGLVPMIANRRVTFRPGCAVRNFDAFDVALNRMG